MKFNSELDLGDILNFVGIIVAFFLSLLIARCSVDWQANKTDYLESNLRYAELVTELYDKLNACEAELAKLRKVEFKKFNEKAEESLISCRSDLSKMRAGFKVLSINLKFEIAKKIYDDLSRFDSDLLMQIKEIQNPGQTDAFDFQVEVTSAISMLIDHEKSDVVDIKSLKALLN